VNINKQIEKYKIIEKQAIRQKSIKKKHIIENYSTKENFLNNLSVNIIKTAAHKDFPELYEFYTSFFTLSDETETFEGFEKALILNKKRELQKQYGNFEEAWIYLKEPEKKKIIGGVNFSVYKSKNIIEKKYWGTVHITYIFVDADYRSLGVAKYLHKLAIKHGEDFIKTKDAVLIFCEQNAPELMSVTEYFTDNINARVDQCERLIWWHKLGYKRLAFNYKQPPLNKGQSVCNNLTLNIKSNKKKVPATLIVFHLERFFNLAVFKGDTSRRDSSYTNQINFLKRNNSINTSGSIKYYKILKQNMYKNPEKWEKIKKLF